MPANDIVPRVWQEIGPELEEQGFELVEVEYGLEGAGRVLRLYIDREGGVTLNDCQAVSQCVGPALDARGFMEDRYSLEVSSPGFDRPIRKPRDFARFTGERIKVTTSVPVNGRKRFKGVLQSFQDGLVAVDCDGEVHSIHIENVRKANLDR